MAMDTYVSPTVVASGTTFAQLQAGGLAGQVARLLAANPALADPTAQATAAPTGGGATGGLLPAGTYYVSYTWTNGVGETAAGTSESNVFTVAATNIPRVTIPALPTGASSARVYLTAAGGASGTGTLYATGVTATTFDLSYAAGSDPLAAPPAANDTAAANAAKFADMPLAGFAGDLYRAIDACLTAYLRGDPVALNELRKRHHRLTAAWKLYAVALDEVGVLLAANPGTLRTKANPPQVLPATTTARTFP